MGRFYTVVVSGVAVTAAQDVFNITAGTGVPFILHEVVLGQYTDFGDAASEILAVNIKRGVSATIGSGGSAATPAKHATIDAAATTTARINDTTQTSAGSGSLTTLRSDAFNIQFGWTFKQLPSQSYVFAPGEICVVSITAPADSITLNCSLVLEEIK